MNVLKKIRLFALTGMVLAAAGCGGGGGSAAGSTPAPTPTPTPAPTPVPPAPAPILLAGAESVVKAPAGVAIDGNGNTFVLNVDTQSIVRISKDGVATTLAGQTGLPGSRDGVGSAASFFLTADSRAAVDTQGNLIVADTCNHLLRKVTPAGVVSTLAGARVKPCRNYDVTTANDPTSTDGTGALAHFYYPRSVAIDSNGDVLVSEAGSRAIRRVTTAGVVITMRYFYGADVSSVSAITVDKFGVAYIATAGTAQKIWQIVAGAPVFVAGGVSWKGAPALPPDGVGSAASFLSIVALAADSTGKVYVADSGPMRELTPSGTVRTLAGAYERGGVNGQGSVARLGRITGIALDAGDNAVISEYDRADWRVVTAAGVVSAFGATSATRDYVDGAGAAARFNLLDSMASGPDGTLYTVDSIRHVVRTVSPAGAVSLFAGVPDSKGAINGAVGVATFSTPRAIAVGKDGVVYVADNNGIRKIAAGQVSLLASAAGMGTISSMAVDAVGNVAVSNVATVFQVSPAGVVTTLVDPVQAAALVKPLLFNQFWPYGMAYDAAGNLYISDNGHAAVYKLTKAGALSVFAGRPGNEGDVDGPVGVATLGYYTADSMVFDDGGNLYLSGQGRLRKVSAAGVVSTPAVTWGMPTVGALAYYKGTLYGATRFAILRMAVD